MPSGTLTAELQLLSKVVASMLNLSAPCLIKSCQMNAGMNFLQWMMGDSADNLGLVLMPLFSHKKNGRILEEIAVTKHLSNTGANLDTMFSLLFQERCDFNLAVTAVLD